MSSRGAFAAGDGSKVISDMDEHSSDSENMRADARKAAQQAIEQVGNGELSDVAKYIKEFFDSKYGLTQTKRDSKTITNARIVREGGGVTQKVLAKTRCVITAKQVDTMKMRGRALLNLACHVEQGRILQLLDLENHSTASSVLVAGPQKKTKVQPIA